MFDLDETIDCFRRGVLEFDCKRMVLSQRKKDGEHFEGQGYIRQSSDGTIVFRIYVTKYEAKPFGHLEALLGTKAGELQSDDAFYELDATGADGTCWAATRIIPAPNWDATDMSVILNGRLQSITAHLDPDWYKSQSGHYLRLHFFEEYDVPLRYMSETERHGSKYMVRDRAEFETCGSKFEVRKREGSGDTVVEVTSDGAFPIAFDLRIQEALQYMTAKTAFWRVRVQGTGDGLHVELALPWRKSSRTQFNPPISPVSSDFHEHGWKLFGKYLEYVATKTRGTYWNPVAYHLYNACEATSNSVDAWAVGVSVAVEAVASLVEVESNEIEVGKIADVQEEMRKWLAEQLTFPKNVKDRIAGQIASLSNKRPQDTMYRLVESGHVEKAYIKAWRDLRNRHVHPTLKDLERPNPIDYQKLIDNIHCAEVVLRQLTFFLIGYEGPFTDYGAPGAQNFLSRQYPLKAA
jgi:hypothetical protein